jgi:ABC-type Fe3+/spermidine/putrescine transport system ATPase subunit
VGPSGAGKTMLLETVAGLERPEAGQIWIDGRAAVNLPAEDRGIGFVYQDCWLFPHMSVRKNIDFAKRYHRRKDRPEGPAVSDLAEMLGIGDLLDRRPRTLSGGERQRVALARALSIRPRLMFLDEPLGMLDPVTREAVAAELHNCHRRFGTTTVHVTHDHAEARSLGDEVAVMLDGALEQSGPSEEVFQRPRTQSLARFLGCENLFECEASASGIAGHVEITLGAQRLSTPSTVAGRAIACVRSEEVLIEPWAEGVSRNAPTACFPGIITEISLRGPLVRMVVQADGVQWVSLVGRSRQDTERYRVGVKVAVVIRADAVHLVSAET